MIYSKSLKGGFVADVHDCASISQTAMTMAANINIEEATANARLIAAAPEMYGMLESLYTEIGEGLIDNEAYINEAEALHVNIGMILKKVRGEP